MKHNHTCERKKKEREVMVDKEETLQSGEGVKRIERVAFVCKQR